MKKIAIDLGASNSRISLVKNNKIIKYIKKNTPNNKKEILKQLYDRIADLMNKDIKGIGIAAPGPLENGIIKDTPNLNLKNFNLKKAIQQKFKIKTEVENDANCVALAEAKLGCKKKNFFILTLGTGIGGGIIINNELYKGKGNAGELGHTILNNQKYFEDLWKENRKLCGKYFKKNTLIKDLLKINNKKAKEITEQAADYIGQAIASLINVFDPDIVVLAGGLRDAGKPFLNMIKKQAKKYVFVPNTPPIIWSKLKHPGTLGASLLIK